MNTLRNLGFPELILAAVLVVILLGAGALFFSQPAQAQRDFVEPVAAHDLTGLQIIDTGRVTCGEDSQNTIEWHNPFGEPIYITQAQIWMGMDMGSLSDFAVWLQRYNTNDDPSRQSTLGHFNWDHYSEPTGPDHSLRMNYSPNYVRLQTDDALFLGYSCSNINDSNAVGHAVVTIWYYRQ